MTGLQKKSITVKFISGGPNKVLGGWKKVDKLISKGDVHLAPESTRQFVVFHICVFFCHFSPSFSIFRPSRCTIVNVRIQCIFFYVYMHLYLILRSYVLLFSSGIFVYLRTVHRLFAG